MLLGLLLPVLAGFVLAKTGYGSRTTQHAVDGVTHKLGLHHQVTVKATDDDHHEKVAEGTATHDRGESQVVDPVRNRKFLGIL